MIYDAHCYLGNNPLWAQTGLPVPLEGPAWVEMMDRAGVDGALVAPPGVGASEDFKPDLVIFSDFGVDDIDFHFVYCLYGSIGPRGCI